MHEDTKLIRLECSFNFYLPFFYVMFCAVSQSKTRKSCAALRARL